MVICLLTGLVIVSSLVASQNNMSEFLQIESSSIIDGASLTIATFTQIPFGTIVLMSGIILFAYSTIISWQYYGNRCLAYFRAGKLHYIYKFSYLLCGFIGACGVGDFL